MTRQPDDKPVAAPATAEPRTKPLLRLVRNEPEQRHPAPLADAPQQGVAMEDWPDDDDPGPSAA
jgi:hypothetical protein